MTFRHNAEKKRQWCERELTKLYTEHNKAKLPEVGALLRKFAGNEDELIRVARAKYCGGAGEAKKTR